MKIHHSLLALLLLVFIAGCSRTATIINYRDTSYSNQEQISESKIKQLIYLACIKAGWTATVESDQFITATYTVGKSRHIAVVDISIKHGFYDLIYQNSTNLRFLASSSPSEGTIHKNYNVWVKKLKRTIDSVLSKPDSVDLNSLPEGLFAEKTILDPMDQLMERQLDLCNDQANTLLTGQVVVNRSLINLKTGDSIFCTAIAVIKKGQFLKLKGQKGNWYQVTAENNIEGWVYSSFVNRQ